MRYHGIKFPNLAALRRAHREWARDTGRADWFHPGANRFFSTAFEDGSQLRGGRFFVTSECYSDVRLFPRRCSVRAILDDGRILTADPINTLSLDQARMLADAMAALWIGGGLSLAADADLLFKSHEWCERMGFPLFLSPEDFANVKEREA